MSTLRVLQLISSGGLYGAENMMMQLSLALMKLGDDVTVGIFRNIRQPNVDLAGEIQRRGLNTRLFDCRSRLDLKTIAAIQTFILEHKIDVVHTHGYKADIYGCLATRGTTTKLVATCHGWPGKSISLKLYATLDRFYLRRFDKVAAVSHAVKQSLVHSGVRQERIRLVENGIDVGAFSVGRPALRDKWNLRGKGVVGFVGRLAPEKGLSYLVQAARSIVAEKPDTRFILTGDGPLREELCAMVMRYHLEDRFLFLGSRPDMADIYASMDIFVLPSLTEGMPMAVLEAMAAGKPVVATHVGQIPDIVTEGETGLLVEPGNASQLTAALKRLLESKRICEEFGKQGQVRVEQNYSSRKMAENYLKIYSEAGVSGKPPEDACVEISTASLERPEA